MHAPFDGPDGIIDKVKAHQSKVAGKRRANCEQKWPVDETAGAHKNRSKLRQTLEHSNRDSLTHPSKIVVQI